MNRYLQILENERKNRELQFEHDVKKMQFEANQNMIQFALDITVAQMNAQMIALSFAIEND